MHTGLLTTRRWHYSIFTCLAVLNVPTNDHRLQSCEGEHMFIEMETGSACSQPDVVRVLGSEIRREDEASMKGKGAAVHGVA